jgi:hypothetical protein
MAPRRRLIPHSWSELLRHFSLAAGAGVAISVLFWVAQHDGPIWLSIVIGALVGGCIYLSTVLIAFLLGAPLARLPERWTRLALVAIFFAAGILGWAVAATLASFATLGRVRFGPVDWRSTLLVEGCLGAGVGVVILTYENLRQRLAESIAKLKETEFAEKELETARDIQRRLLPPAEYAAEGFRLAARIEPAGLVAGDFYDYFRLADGRLLAVVADVAGKGMGASLLMASAKAMLPFVAAQGGAAGLLTALNSRLAASLGSREFVALAVLLLDPASGSFELANAGLPDPYRLAPGGGARALAVPGPRLPLGLRPAVAYEPLAGVLAPGERILLVSDGLPEAPLAGGEPLGYALFEELIAAEPAGGAAGLAALFSAVARRTQAARADDWTALLVERPIGGA